MDKQGQAIWKVLWVGPRDKRAERAIVVRLCCGSWCGCDGPDRWDCSGGECPRLEITSPALPPEDILGARNWALDNLLDTDVVAISGEIPWQIMAAIQYYSVWAQKHIPMYYLVPGECWEPE